MGGCAFGLRSQFNAEPANEQATDTLPCASPAITRICCRRDSCATADKTERVQTNAKRMRHGIGNPTTLEDDDSCSVHNNLRPDVDSMHSR